ncbi:MAG: hypothetical protein AAFU73_10310 [Planctomycetota bacterium]
MLPSLLLTAALASPFPTAGDSAAELLRAYLDARSSGASAAEERAALEAALPPGVLAQAQTLNAIVADALRPAESVVRPGNVRSLRYERGAFVGEALDYAVRLPRAYGKDDGPWPLVLALPPEGKSGAEHLRERWSTSDITETSILVAPDLAGDPARWDRVSVDGRPGRIARALTALRLAREEFDVDPDRVVIAGEGDGVSTALQTVRQERHRFAGVVGRSGEIPEAKPQAFLSIPVLLGGCGPSADAFETACTSEGAEGIELRPSLDDEASARWILARRRTAAPEEVKLAIDPTIPNSAHWVHIAPTTPNSVLRATVDRETNRIELWTSEIAYVTLHLSDELLDLGAPIKIRHHAQVRTFEVERSLERTLDAIADGRSDGGLVYTAELVIDTRGENEAPPSSPDAALRTNAERAVVAHLADPGRSAARGWSERGGAWYHPRDKRRIKRGDRRDAETWLWSPRAARKAGRARVDDAWYAPEDVVPGRWPVEGEWLPLAAADVRHSRIGTPWVLPSAHVRLRTTTSRRTGFAAIAETAHCVPILERALGVVPNLPVDVVLLRNEEQYDRYAFGSADGSRPPAHAQAHNLVHSAFFAERRTRLDGRKRAYAGAGVGLWDADYQSGDAYGRHGARLAYALSWLDAVDPSPRATRALGAGDADATYTQAFEAEKALPQWLRWGVAVYVERFFFDDRIDASDPRANLWWARDWSLQNLGHDGGSTDLDALFAFDLRPEDRAWSRRLMLTAGAAVGFVLDGGCAPAEEAHAALRAALVRGKDPGRAIEALEAALRAHPAEFDAYLGDAAKR